MSNTHSRTTPKEFRRALLIGLGGSGQKVLVHLKRMFIDECGSVPPCIRFLALDTSSEKDNLISQRTGKEIRLSHREFIHLAVQNAADFVKSSPAIKSWLIKPAPKGAILNGTGAVRQTGRIALYKHLDFVRACLEQIFTDLSSVKLEDRMRKAGFELLACKPEISLTGSLAGGTGSGTFLDMGIMCRDLTKVQDTFITGYFMLPWIYRDKPATFRTPSNTYAALSEIDTLLEQSIEEDGDVPLTQQGEPLKVIHCNDVVSVTDPPFQLFHLIDGRNEFNENVNSVDALAGSIAQAIFLNLGAMGRKADDHINNVLSSIHAMDPQLWDGKQPFYTSFGVGSLVYPAEENHLMRSLAGADRLADSAIQDCLARGTQVEPSQQVYDSVRSFQRANDLASENMPQFMGSLLNVKSLRTHFEFDDTISYNDKRLEDTVTRYRDRHLQKLESQIKVQLEGNSERLAAELGKKIKAELAKHSMEEDDGRRHPNFTLSWAEALRAELEANKTAALEEVSRCDRQLRDIRESEQFQKEAIKAPKRLLGIFNKQRQNACAAYARVISGQAESMVSRAVAKRAADLYGWLVRVLEQDIDGLRQEVTTTPRVVENLKSVRARYARQMHMLKAEERRRRESPFEIMVGRADYYYYEDQDLTEVSYDEFKSKCKIKGSRSYSSRKPDDLDTLFLDYAKECFRPMLDVTIDDVLRKIEEEEPGHMDRCIYDLLRLSSPLWSYHTEQVTMARAAQMCSIIVCGSYDRTQGEAAYGPSIEKHNDAMKLRYDPSWVSTGDPYRILMLRYSVSVPAYVLLDMDEYRRKYEAVLSPSSHIDRWFEFSVPSLFPENEIANIAMRVVTLGIIDEVGVITDERLIEGHRYTIDYERLNSKHAPIVRNDFISLFELVSGNQKVLQVLSDEMVKKFAGMPWTVLHDAVEQHLGEVEKRSKSKDFNKLVTGRFYFREIDILKDFLDECAPQGDQTSADEKQIKKFLRGL